MQRENRGDVSVITLPGRIKLEAPVNRVPATLTITMTTRRVRITSRRADGCHETTINDPPDRIDTNNIYRAVSSPDKSAKLRHELSLSAPTSNEIHGRGIKRGRVDVQIVCK